MATVKATKDPRPKRPRVDKGMEFEQLLRPLLKVKVDSWCVENKELLDEQPDKETKGAVVDDLVADFSSAFETLAEAIVHSYLSGVVDEGDDDDDDSDDSDEGESVKAG